MFKTDGDISADASFTGKLSCCFYRYFMMKCGYITVCRNAQVSSAEIGLIEKFIYIA